MGKNELVTTAITPPLPSDYAQETVKKRVVSANLLHPLTVFPVAGGIGMALVGAILNLPVFYAISLVGIIGPLNAIVQLFFRSDTHVKKYLAELDRRRDEYKQQLMANVKNGLGNAFFTTEANEHARQGWEQFDRVSLVRNGIQELLYLKLNSHELTFHRFLGATEQAYFSILDNLRDIVAALKSINSIDPDDLRKRIKRFERCGKISAADQEERGTLEERLKIWEDQMERVDDLLAKDEVVITGMEKISSQISEWKTDQSFSARDLESTISELQDLAMFAHKLKNQLQ